MKGYQFMKLKYAALILILVIAIISCKTSRDEQAPSRCKNQFVNKKWGISLCLIDPFSYRRGAGTLSDRVYLGPKTDWPFYDKHHPYMLKPVPRSDEEGLLAGLKKLEKKHGGDADTGASPKRKVRVRKIDTFHVKSHTVVAFNRTSIHAQCEEVVHTVIGKKYNYEIVYPSCGGIVDEIFHFDARMYFKDIISSLKFIE
jgi:hypothetical protein